VQSNCIVNTHVMQLILKHFSFSCTLLQKEVLFDKSTTFQWWEEGGFYV